MGSGTKAQYNDQTIETPSISIFCTYNSNMDRELQKHEVVPSKTPVYAVEEYNSGATYKQATQGLGRENGKSTSVVFKSSTLQQCKFRNNMSWISEIGEKRNLKSRARPRISS